MSVETKAEFIENFLVVWDSSKGGNLFKFGFYGKPLGIPKPKSYKFNVPLILDLLEGLYLIEKGIVKAYEGFSKREITFATVKDRAMKLYDQFEQKYAVYRDLRTKGLIVNPGVKYGCDFAIYRQGPGIDHAPYMVSVKSCRDISTATEIVKAGRLATTVRKRFIVAIPDLEENKVEYLIFKWFKA